MNESSLRSALGSELSNTFDTIKVEECIDSTNAELLRMVDLGSNGLNLIIAKSQSAGRGRHGKQWHSPLNAGIYMSLGLSFPNSTKDLQALSLLTGIALANACKHQLALEVQLKWPNDVLVSNKKLAGILLERIPLGKESYLIFGIGINLVLSDEDKLKIQRPATDLASLRQVPIDESAFTAEVVLQLLSVIDEFRKGGFQGFQEQWNALDRHYGSDIVLQSENTQLIGRSQGVNANGCLQLLTPAGIKLVSSGEVFPSLTESREED